jgi:hypothetical protein
MAKGGKQPGAGRPKIRDHFSEAEIAELVAAAKEKAITDPNLMKFLLEQIFGKAVQPIGGDVDRPLTISFDTAFNAATQ